MNMWHYQSNISYRSPLMDSACTYVGVRMCTLMHIHYARDKASPEVPVASHV